MQICRVIDVPGLRIVGRYSASIVGNLVHLAQSIDISPCITGKDNAVFLLSEMLECPLSNHCILI